MHEPGDLLAAGREADVFVYGPGAVLRRSRVGHSQSVAARVMAYLHSTGYPVPEVHEVSDDGLDVVMERLDGASMGDRMAREPWRLGYYAGQLAELQSSLHAVAAPEWISDLPAKLRDPGNTLVHLDLHPLNVMVTSRGPVVIDWANVSRGRWGDDVAMSWLLMSSAQIPGRWPGTWLMGSLRHRFVRRYLSAFDLDEVRARLAIAAEWKCSDPNMSQAEVARIRVVIAESGSS